MACATTKRATSCATACRWVISRCLSLEHRLARHRWPGQNLPHRLPRSHPVRSQLRLLRPQERPRQPALAHGGRDLARRLCPVCQPATAQGRPPPDRPAHPPARQSPFRHPGRAPPFPAPVRARRGADSGLIPPAPLKAAPDGGGAPGKAGPGPPTARGRAPARWSRFRW